MPAAAAAKSLQLCPTLCDPIDGSPPGSPVPGILQARVLEWGAITFSGDPNLGSHYSISPTSQLPTLLWSQPGANPQPNQQVEHCLLIFI